MLIAARYSMLGEGGGDVVFATHFEVTTGSSYFTTGIYSATAIDPTTPVVVDWGDGSTDSVTGNISQLTHTYTSSGVYTVGISDNISTLALSSQSTTWTMVTTGNYKNITKIIDISQNITQIPEYGLFRLMSLTYLYAGDSGSLTFGAYALGEIGSFNNGIYVSVDLSGRTMSRLSFQCFRYASLASIRWPIGITIIDEYCFFFTNFKRTLNPDTDKFTYFDMTVPEGVESIAKSAFSSAGSADASAPLVEITLPSTLTYISDWAFEGCLYLRTIRCNAEHAPVALSSTFGVGDSDYTGRYSASAGTNRLYVPAGATGYDSGYWLDPLQDSTKCGFTLEEV